MTIKTGKYSGFCFGVDRIVKKTLEESKKGKVYTLGPITHNKHVVAELAEYGTEIVNSAIELKDKPPGTVIIRAHGVPPEEYSVLNRLGVNYLDYTCPDVKRIQKLAAKAYAEGRNVIITGDADHPEVVGINGHTCNKSIVINSLEDAKSQNFDLGKTYTLLSQTTFFAREFERITEYLSGILTRLEIHDTICRSTVERQKEAAELAKECGCMVVLGDQSSSNSTKLFEICREIQINTFFIETIEEINQKLLNILKSSVMIVGVTAGASTSPAMIKEAVTLMSEMNTVNADQNFENMIAGVSMVLRTGETVRGKVIKVANGEVFVDLGYKSDGIVQKGEYSDDTDADPAKELKPGDEIDVYVVRVNDGEGNVLLSKKRADGRKSMLDIESAFKNNTPLPGKVVEIVKGGCTVLILGVRTFVPSSQASSRFIPDLNELKGKEFNFNILEFDKAKKRIIAGRKELAVKEIQDKKDQAFSSIKIGDRIIGKVSRIAQFGAFVDLGGVDGLIHISEMSWGRIRRVTDVVKEGNEVSVVVIGLDPEKGKISLSLREVSPNPWVNIDKKYPIGSIVDGKVARITAFGAFVELEEGIDGLVHISQVTGRHIDKVEEELKIGQIIKVKITAVDNDKKRISLSKKVADTEIYFDYLDDEPYDDEYDDEYDDNYDDGYDDGYNEAAPAAEAQSSPASEPETKPEAKSETEPAPEN